MNKGEKPFQSVIINLGLKRRKKFMKKTGYKDYFKNRENSSTYKKQYDSKT